MSNPYEIDHNIEPHESSCRRPRRPSMSTFFSQLSQIETSLSHANLHATPTPVEMAAAERLLQDQLHSFVSLSSSVEHSAFLENLILSIERDIAQPPAVVPGVSQEYLDQLERVPRKTLKRGEECKICGEEFLEDEFALVVQLPCHPLHRFDLECVGPWLRLQGTCPVDRKNLEGDRKKRLQEIEKMGREIEDEEDYDEMFA